MPILTMSKLCFTNDAHIKTHYHLKAINSYLMHCSLYAQRSSYAKHPSAGSLQCLNSNYHIMQKFAYECENSTYECKSMNFSTFNHQLRVIQIMFQLVPKFEFLQNSSMSSFINFEIRFFDAQCDVPLSHKQHTLSRFATAISNHLLYWAVHHLNLLLFQFI